jgi:deoxyribonuclease-4
MIKVGPAGIGGAKEAEGNLKSFSERGLGVAEVAYTYGVYLKKNDAIRIGKFAKACKIELSIHAPYYVNLNSSDKKKIQQSKRRILQCCESAHYLGAKRIVFHPGFYGKIGIEETYENIKREILDIIDYIKKKGWKIILCPETTGKVNVFGGLDEVLRLAKEIKCGFCIDFAHLKARSLGKLNLDEVLNKIKKYKHVHCHYSGIAYSNKGERYHKNVDIREWRMISNKIKKLKNDFSVICESPDPFGDAVKMRKVL